MNTEELKPDQETNAATTISRLKAELAKELNITAIQQKQIERLLQARDAEKARADKAEALPIAQATLLKGAK